MKAVLAQTEPAIGRTADLASGATGAGLTHGFAWNSVADLGATNVPQVRLRITPSDDWNGDEKEKMAEPDHGANAQ